MDILNLEGASIWMRILAAVLAFIVLSGAAAAALVASMMFVLFSADGMNSAEPNNAIFNRMMYAVLASLAVAVVVPPVMLLFRMSPIHSAIPAGIGFTCAGMTTMWYIMSSLGAN